ncbi:hypothetical protein [Tenacibaculum sp. IB213877]|uniref:hypothetical protein n=1 Tax=Tenacibaculum sp. IB213877 TaxID=3097351 RepID=UPI002A59EFE7|nr:hypothetical protein [Tenacibaculum sp. IB213877]MDY0780768.1 hypothetical protein [Tenacibaculum sp. IB213877]
MKNKLTLLLSAFLLFNTTYAQKEKTLKLGQATIDELKLRIYDKDSTANALVLYEHANVYIDEKNNYKFRTDYYYRIKIFNKEEYKRATIKLRLYKDEFVKNVEATTYNLVGENSKKIFLSDDKVYTKQISENYKEISFTMPNVKEGSVIEYKYSVLSPYSRLDDWYFQSDIPKLKSDYFSSIPGNWKYSIRKIGYKKLDRQNSSVKKGCIYIPGIGEGDCAALEYGMDHVPTFKKEDYMLSEENFLSRLAFELISFTNTRGVITKYTKTWEDADKTLKRNFLDGQTSKKNYFRKNLPLNILDNPNQFQKAKDIYYHIQDRMSWNERYWTSEKLKVKNIYNEKTGSVDAINLTLFNALQAGGIESYIVMASTRNNGLPTKLHPVVDDFNYVLVKAVINNENYFLDATDKFLPFGEVPVRCLNGEGRVLDFEKGSYWEVIKSRFRNASRTKIQLTLNEDNTLSGEILSIDKGYYALTQRKNISGKNTDEYLDYFETKFPNIEVDNVEISNDTDNEKPLKIIYEVNVDDINYSNKKIKFNPFLISRISKNPFKLNERNYPVDFGYAWSDTYLINIKIPEGFKVTKSINNKAISLPNKGGKYILKVNSTENSISIYIKYQIDRKTFFAQEYPYLKEFFNQIIKTQKSTIELEKTTSKN